MRSVHLHHQCGSLCRSRPRRQADVPWPLRRPDRGKAIRSDYASVSEKSQKVVTQGVEASPPPPRRPARQNSPIWVPSTYKMAIAAAIAFAQAQKLWQKKKNGAAGEQGSHGIASPAQTPGFLDCARWLANAESAGSAEADAVFAAADTNRDGRVDLLELMRAAYKWAPLGAANNDNDSLAAARDSALDFFLLLPADPIGGLDREQFGRFVQAWCLQAGWGLKAVSGDLVKLLEAPDHLRHAKDRETAEGIEAATATPQAVVGWMERRRADLAFALWDSGRTGRVGRAALCHALSWFLEHVSEEEIRRGGGSAGAARSLLASEGRRGRPDLARPEFLSLVQRFAELAGQAKHGVNDYLIALAINGMARRSSQPEGNAAGTTTEDNTVMRSDMMK